MNKMISLEPTPKQLLLSAVLILLWIDHVIAQGDPLLGSTQFPCYNSDNYTSNSTFQTNLNILFSSHVSNGSKNGFFNTSVGVSPEIVYGFVQCRGDISRDACLSCLSTSTVEVIRYCPNRKVAARRYDHCIMRYSNVRFFSQLDTNVRSECSPAQVSDADASRFEDQLRNLLTNVSEVAASRPNRFGSETAVDNSIGKTVIGWVQCNQDLSPTNCSSCVKNLISEIPDRCDKRPGAKIFSATCYLRFEQYSFPIALSPPPPAIALSPPPPAIVLSPPPAEPRERDGSGNGNIPESAKGKSSTNAAVIIVPTIASALLVGTSVYLIRREIKKNVRNPTPKIIYDQDGKISISAEPLQFDLNTIRTATNNFSDANKLGEGGFGAVYKKGGDASK